MSADVPLTTSVPKFFRAAYDGGENAAYAAAKRGDFPVMRIGAKCRVPLRLAAKKLAGGDPALAEEVLIDLVHKLSKDQGA